MRGLHLLTDFDGVWTDPRKEAVHIAARMRDLVVAATGERGPVVESVFREWQDKVLLRPFESGWMHDGKLVAFIDEDPFCIPNAVATCLEAGIDDRAMAWRSELQAAGHTCMRAFADHCFIAATEDYRRGHPPDLLPETPPVLDGLLADGVRVTVATNSPFEKIAHWLGSAGFRCVPAGEAAANGEIRVQGEAGKETIAPESRPLPLGGRLVEVDRPVYRDLLRREAADVVLGDVFSLDLATPYQMRVMGEAGAPRGILLRHARHTPPWSLALASGPEAAVDAVIGDLAELPVVLARFA